MIRIVIWEKIKNLNFHEIYQFLNLTHEGGPVIY